MNFYFIDDSKIKSASHCRERMNDLVAVGGLVVSAEQLKRVEDKLKEICSSLEYNVPIKENIKWSPAKGSWLQRELDGDKRQKLFRDLLDCLNEHECKAIVAISDVACRKANESASTHEIDATLLALERFDTWVGDSSGVVFVSKPSGGIRDSNRFVAECIDTIYGGTKYVKFDNLALVPVIMPAWQSRMLQAADLICSITNATVAGGNKYAESLFPRVRSLMVSSRKGVIGGVGLKLHSSYRYRNLYHWLLGDSYYVQGNSGRTLPDSSFPYAKNAMKFWE